MGKPERISKTIGSGYVPDFDAEPYIPDCLENCEACPERRVCALAVRKMILIYNEVITRKSTMTEATEKIRAKFGSAILERKTYPHWNTVVGKDEMKVFMEAIEKLRGKEGFEKEKEWKKVDEAPRALVGDLIRKCIAYEWYAPTIIKGELKFRKPLKASEAQPTIGSGTITRKGPVDPDFIPEIEETFEQGELDFMTEVYNGA